MQINSRDEHHQTTQEQTWQGHFGKGYTDRNMMSPVELDSFHQQTYGISRTEMNADFIGFLDRSVKILEVGANVGDQLACLRAMDFQNLHGIELQSYAVEVSKRRKGINIIQGSAFDLPYRDGHFDLVFTSGVLIHIAPTDLLNVLREILSPLRAACFAKRS